MKQKQTGEAMVAVMVIVLVVMWLSNGRMGMMGHGHGHADLSETVPPPQTVSTPEPTFGELAQPKR
ncbi:MAG: hypothetical protein KKG03_05350 [Gammaproteobacteria bacterium]|jgi:hypothetical protein|nr:hypothetical protein [Sideroxydans sp.]MBU3903933.1 hypothetical protein [Gammaproteobacteria bacterium]MBU4045360.1 hypothetical protein [Gammaproteobacteria bacterium]MBU4151061.1 hypothetical protein [Gammaproteobacteria bacterium]